MAINLKAITPHKISRDLSGYMTYLYGPGGAGKAQPIDTEIPTPIGFRLLGDLKPGDEVFDRKGQPTKIVDVFPQGRLPVYKVVFEDGRSTLCNDEHIFSVYTSRGNLKNITVREMIEHGLKDKYSTYYYSIPINKAVEYSEKEYSIHPYVIGCFLGDGCCKERQLTISSSDEELVANIARLIKSEEYVKNPTNNYSWTFKQPKDKPLRNYHNMPITKIQTKEIFSKYLSEMCVGAEEKRIPSEYLEGSIEQRWNLLRGLMDTDGSIESTKGAIRFTSISKNLVKDVVRLVNSLGYRATIQEDRRQDKNYNICYNVSILSPNEDKYKFFNLERKREIALKFIDVSKRRNYNILKITDIKRMDYETEMKCIYVDNPEHLYLTNDYITTHNTTFGVSAPKPLLLAFEKGYNALGGENVMPQDITSWAEMKQVLRQLDDPEVKGMFSTIVVDTIDKAAQLCEKYVCNQLGIENIGDGGWSVNGWAKVKKEWEQTFNSIAMKNYAIIFISHSKEKTIKRKDGTEYNQIVPSCSNAYNEIVRNMVDLEGYIDVQDGNRKLILRSPDDSVECKSRFKYMASEIPFSYKDLVAEMNRAIDEESQHIGENFTTTKKEEIKAETKYDYEALMLEFQELAGKLMNDANAQMNGKKLTSIIDKYLGKGKKVSEATPEQAELIYLVIEEAKDILPH